MALAYGNAIGSSQFHFVNEKLPHAIHDHDIIVGSGQVGWSDLCSMHPLC